MQQISDKEFFKWLAVNNGQKDKIALLSLRIDWAQAVGKAIAMNSSPCCIKNENGPQGEAYLLVVCSNGSWAQELQLQQLYIVNKLGHKYGFKKIRTYVGKVNSIYKKKKSSILNYVPKELVVSDDEEEQVDKASEHIKDEKLKKSFQTFLKTVILSKRAALKNGAKLCPKCHMPTYSTDPLCFNCQNEENISTKTITVSKLNRDSAASKESINSELEKAKLQPLMDYQYIDIKNSFNSQKRAEIWKEINRLDEGSALPDDLKGSIIELASSISDKPVYELTDTDVKKALHPRLSRIYFTDSIIHFAADNCEKNDEK